jgi:hypothetical protein
VPEEEILVYLERGENISKQGGPIQKDSGRETKIWLPKRQGHVLSLLGHRLIWLVLHSNFKCTFYRFFQHLKPIRARASSILPACAFSPRG